MSGYVDTSKISIERVNREFVDEFVTKKHYAGTWTEATDIFGVVYESDNEHSFFDMNEKKLIGAVVYGHCVGYRVVKSISDLLDNDSVLELKRLFIEDGYGKNIESYVISQTLRMLKQERPEIKCIISYADPAAGHTGTIYQAANFFYQGNTIGIGDSYMYRLPGRQEWITDRAIASKYGTCSLPKLLDIVPDIEYKRKLRKHRYIYFNCDKREKRELLKSLKYPIESYDSITNE